MSFQDMEIKTEIVEDQKTSDIFASSFNDQNRPTESDLNEGLLIVPDLNEAEDRNDFVDISTGPVFKLKAEGIF